MLLVPKQLRRAGMTGNVPYYGGRLTPAQAYAASHAYHPQAPVAQTGRHAVPTTQPVPTGSASALEALQHLLDTGVITPAEYQELRARVTP